MEAICRHEIPSCEVRLSKSMSNLAAAQWPTETFCSGDSNGAGPATLIIMYTTSNNRRHILLYPRLILQIPLMRHGHQLEMLLLSSLAMTFTCYPQLSVCINYLLSSVY